MEAPTVCILCPQCPFHLFFHPYLLEVLVFGHSLIFGFPRNVPRKFPYHLPPFLDVHLNFWLNEKRLSCGISFKKGTNFPTFLSYAELPFQKEICEFPGKVTGKSENYLACNAGVFWRAIERILTKRAPSWILGENPRWIGLGRDEMVS